LLKDVVEPSISGGIGRSRLKGGRLLIDRSEDENGSKPARRVIQRRESVFNFRAGKMAQDLRSRNQGSLRPSEREFLFSRESSSGKRGYLRGKGLHFMVGYTFEVRRGGGPGVEEQ